MPLPNVTVTKASTVVVPPYGQKSFAIGDIVTSDSPYYFPLINAGATNIVVTPPGGGGGGADLSNYFTKAESDARFVNESDYTPPTGPSIVPYAGFSDYPLGYYATPPYSTNGVTGGGDGREYFTPFPVVNRFDGSLPKFDRVGVNLTSPTGVPGSVSRILIRKSVKGMPKDIVVNCGTVNDNTTGWQEVVIDWQPTSVGLYFVTLVTPNGARFLAISSDGTGGFPQGDAHRRGFFLGVSPNVASPEDPSTVTLIDGDRAPFFGLRVYA